MIHVTMDETISSVIIRDSCDQSCDRIIVEVKEQLPYKKFDVCRKDCDFDDFDTDY